MESRRKRNLKRRGLGRLKNSREFREWNWRNLCTFFTSVALPFWNFKDVCKSLPRIRPADLIIMLDRLEKDGVRFISSSPGIPAMSWDFSEISKSRDRYYKYAAAINVESLRDV